MKKSSRKKRIPWGQLFGVLLGLLLGIAFGFYIYPIIEVCTTTSTAPVLLTTLILLAMLYAAILLQTIVHEAGHLVCGLLSGYKFSSFRIVSFTWLKIDGKIRLRRHSVMGTAGQCLMTPPDMLDGTIPVMLYNLGGVLANLIVSALCAAAYALTRTHPLLSGFFLSCTLAGLLLGLLNGIPLHMGAIDNDGMNALSLRRNPEAMRALWLQLKINEQMTQGVRLKDMPAEWFELPSDAAMKSALSAAIGVFACNRLMDAHLFQEADRLMARLLEMDSGILPLHRALLVCDRMYIEIIGENRPNVLAAMMTREQEKFMKSMQRSLSVLRTEYARALLSEPNLDRAVRLHRTFERLAARYTYEADAQSERELMDIAKQKRSDLPMARD